MALAWTGEVQDVGDQAAPLPWLRHNSGQLPTSHLCKQRDERVSVAVVDTTESWRGKEREGRRPHGLEATFFNLGSRRGVAMLCDDSEAAEAHRPS